MHYCPAADAERLRADEPDAFPGDHCMRVRTFTDFAAAAAFAVKVAKTDWFGVASIHRMVCESPRYDWWDCTGAWCVDHETDPAKLDPEGPDLT